MTYIAFPYPLAYESARSMNPLDKVTKQTPAVVPPLTEQQYQYRWYLIHLMQRAKENRDRAHAEFSGKTYLQYYEENEKIANTYIEPTKNKNEEKLSTGTVEAKLNTLLSHINNLNLTPEVMAYDRNNTSLIELGQAFTDIMAVVAEHDGDDDGGDKEKRMLRQRELMKQGTVFVQEDWVTKYEVKKKLARDFNGKFTDFAGYTEKLEKVYEGCSRQVLYGPGVYLGDITAFSMNDQPFVFTVEAVDYRVAKTLYGQFEMFQYVRPGKPETVAETTTTSSSGGTIYDTKWRLTNLQDDQVEIIKFQCQSKDEYMIMINGIMLLPPGFPLSAVTPRGKYNIAKQTLYVVNPQFAYGKAFVSSGAVYELSKSLDRMLRLFELKTRKSITPPYINTTNRVIPARVLDPGNISMGLNPTALQPIGSEGQGVTANEFQIFKELQDEIEKSTISSIFQGQQAKSGATATEIIEVQRQAKLTLGLIMSACTLLEVKCGYLRHWHLLGKWLDPVGVYPDGTKRYRSVTRKTAIPGQGTGERRVIPIDGELPKPEVVRMLSLKDEQERGYAVRRTYLSPKMVREAQILWYIVVQQKEEESSAYHKISFREMMTDALTLLQLGAQPNIEGITDEFGKVYGVDKSKVFGGANMIPSPLSGIDPARVAGDRASGNINASGVGQPQPKPQVTRQ